MGQRRPALRSRRTFDEVGPVIRDETGSAGSAGLDLLTRLAKLAAVQPMDDQRLAAVEQPEARLILVLDRAAGVVQQRLGTPGLPTSRPLSALIRARRIFAG